MTKKNKEKLLGGLDTSAMYVFSLMGVLLSKYIPQLREGSEILIDISWGQFLVSLLVAFMMLSAAEQLGGSDSAGKRKRFLWRAIAAVSYGSFWYNIIGG